MKIKLIYKSQVIFSLKNVNIIAVWQIDPYTKKKIYKTFAIRLGEKN